MVVPSSLHRFHLTVGDKYEQEAVDSVPTLTRLEEDPSLSWPGPEHSMSGMG